MMMIVIVFRDVTEHVEAMENVWKLKWRWKFIFSQKSRRQCLRSSHGKHDNMSDSAERNVVFRRIAVSDYF